MPSTDIIALIAIGISILTFLWTVGWALWLDRRATRAQASVEASLLTSAKTGAASVLKVHVTNGPHRATTIRHVSIEPKGGKAFNITPPVLTTLQPLEAKLAPHDEWTGSAVLTMLARLQPPDDPLREFRVAIHHDGRRDRSKTIKLDA